MRQNPLTYCFNKAKQYYKEDKLDEARDYLDKMSAYCAQITKDIKGTLEPSFWDQHDAFQQLHKDVVVEGYPLETWKMRYWVKLENWGLLL